MKIERGIKMKTVQTVMREADRDSLLEALFYDVLYDMQLLLELMVRTITEIQEACPCPLHALLSVRFSS